MRVTKKPVPNAGKLLSASDGTLYKIQADGSWKVTAPGLKPKEIRRRAKLQRERKKAEKEAAETKERVWQHSFKPLLDEEEEAA